MTKKQFAAVFSAVAFFISGCGDEAVSDSYIPMVQTQAVDIKKSSNVGQNYTGTVRGRFETNMAFQVGGQISERRVQVGSRVRAGDVLMTINPRDVIEQTRQAEAQTQAAKSQLELARTNLDRYEKLFEQDVISRSVLDQYRTNFDAANAQYQAAVAAESASRNALSYTNLTADSDGIISNINVESGQIVSAGQVVCTLIQTNELEVAINVPENRLSEVEIGKAVAINFWAVDGDFTGVVREVSPMADQLTRTFAIKISIPDPPENLQLGMTASVQTFDQNLTSGLVEIPLSSIFQTDDQPQIWLVQNNSVSSKKIEVVSMNDKTAFVRGLKPGSVIVTAGVHKLNDGDPVRLAGENR